MTGTLKEMMKPDGKKILLQFVFESKDPINSISIPKFGFIIIYNFKENQG